MESTLIVSSVTPPKKFRCPYFREEGGGQERYKNFLIFYFLIRGRREGVQVNKDNFFIYALFFIDGFPKETKICTLSRDLQYGIIEL